MNSSNLVDQPDPALFLKSDRVGDQPVTRPSPRQCGAAQDPSAREGMVGGIANAPARDTANTSSSEHARLPTRLIWLLPVA